MNRIIFFSTFCFLIIFTSCKTGKNTQSTYGGKETAYKVAVEEIDFNYFNSKAKVNYDDGKSSLGFVVNIRMKKDSIIWMSALAPFGLEAARALITRDSVKIMDRLNNRYEEYSISWLKQNFNADLSFENLQNLLLGNMVVPPYKQNKVNDAEGSDCVVIEQKMDNMSISNSISREKKKVIALNIKENTGNNLSVNYSEFGQLGKYIFPFENIIEANVREKGQDKTVKIMIKHNKAEISDEPLNFAFNVPSKFKKR